MEFKVILSEDAENDLFDIYYYVATEDSFEKADKLRDKLLAAVSTLSKFPLRGHKVREIFDTDPILLEIIKDKYRIIYEIEEKIVVVHAILDGRRNLLVLLSERFLRW